MNGERITSDDSENAAEDSAERGLVAYLPTPEQIAAECKLIRAERAAEESEDA